MAFWGLVLEPKKQYSQTVEQPFHISMAALDLSSSDAGEESSSVVLRREGSDFILCNLSRKHKLLNAPLDLNFDVGDEINFHVNGNSSIHLTGHIADESMEGFDTDESGDEEQEDEEETGRSPLLKATKKLLDQAEKRKADFVTANAAKKSKLATLEEEEDDSDDSDFDMDGSDDDIEEEEEDDDVEDEEDDSDDDPEALLKKMEAAKKQEAQAKKDKSKQGGKQVQQGGKNQQSPTPAGQGKAKKDKQNKQPQQQQQQQKQKSPNANPQDKQSNEKQKTNGAGKKYTSHGVMIEDQLIGSGAVAKAGRLVTVHYVGRLKNNNKQFDSQSGPGFRFRLGHGEVIKGWDFGLIGMRVGGKRRLSIPPHLAYGSKGSPPVIPPNSPLVFDVELKSVQ